MNRQNKTVEQLYQEWTVGSHGCLPIAELDRRYGCDWRRGRGPEVQYYSLRREVVLEIDRLADHDRINKDTAMRRLQGRQDTERWSLDKLAKRLRLERREREQRQRLLRQQQYR
jgi:hypothetical protein